MPTAGHGRIQSLPMRKQELREDKDLVSGMEEDACKTGDTRLSLPPAPHLSQHHPASGDITWSFMFQQWGQAEFPGVVKVTASRKIQVLCSGKVSALAMLQVLGGPFCNGVQAQGGLNACAWYEQAYGLSQNTLGTQHGEDRCGPHNLISAHASSKRGV